MPRPIWVLTAAVAFTGIGSAAEAPPVYLWEKGAPGFEDRKDIKEIRDNENAKTGTYRVTNVHNPYVHVFLPKKEVATGAGLVIIPGGGHSAMWPMNEGDFPAQWLADRGVAVVALRYRLARENPKRDGYTIDGHATQDSQRALRFVRSKAKEWGIDPDRVGVMGFSAGGELAALVCRKAEKGNPTAADPVDRESAVPSFQALVYPGPQGIIRQTITKENCPPTWIAIGGNDGQVNNVIAHFRAIRKAGIPAELHIFAGAGHPTGFRPTDKNPASGWQDRFYEWLKDQKIVAKP